MLSPCMVNEAKQVNIRFTTDQTYVWTWTQSMCATHKTAILYVTLHNHFHAQWPFLFSNFQDFLTYSLTGGFNSRCNEVFWMNDRSGAIYLAQSLLDTGDVSFSVGVLDPCKIGFILHGNSILLKVRMFGHQTTWWFQQFSKLPSISCLKFLLDDLLNF